MNRKERLMRRKESEIDTMTNLINRIEHHSYHEKFINVKKHSWKVTKKLKSNKAGDNDSK